MLTLQSNFKLLKNSVPTNMLFVQEKKGRGYFHVFSKAREQNRKRRSVSKWLETGNRHRTWRMSNFRDEISRFFRFLFPLSCREFLRLPELSQILSKQPLIVVERKHGQRVQKVVACDGLALLLGAFFRSPSIGAKRTRRRTIS